MSAPKPLPLLLCLFLAFSFNLRASVLPIYKNLLPNWKTWTISRGILKDVKGSLQWIISDKETVSTVSIPLNDSLITVADGLDIEIDSSDINVCIVAEVKSTPSGDILEMKKDLELKKGSNRFHLNLPYTNSKRTMPCLHLTLYNKADNMHIPQSDVSDALIIKDIKIGIRNKDFLSFPAHRTTYLPAKEKQAFHKQFTELVAHVENAQDYETRIRALQAIQEWKSTFGWKYEKSDIQQLFAKHGDIIYGVTGGVDKILRQDIFPGSKLGIAHVSLGRNEAEGVQIALMSKRNLQDVSCLVGPLKDNHGNVLPAAQITAMPVTYIHPEQPAYACEAYSTRPDPLLPHGSTFNVDAWNYAPIWIDVKTRPKEVPGVYRGKIAFQVNGKQILNVPLEVTVWNFCLPDSMSFPIVFATDGLAVSYFWAKAYGFSHEACKEASTCFMSEQPKPEKLSQEAQKVWNMGWTMITMLKEHHIPLDGFYRSIGNVLPKWQRLRNRKAQSWYSLGYLNRPNFMELLAPQVKAMRAEGSIDRAYVYGFDEIKSQSDFNRMKHEFGAIKKAYPDLKTMAPALDYTCGQRTGITDELDIWVFPPPNYLHSMRSFPNIRKQGREVWWYPCNWPYPPDANFLLENQGTATRLFMGAMPWKWNVDGCLYYATTMWKTYEVSSCYLGEWSRDVAGKSQKIKVMPLPWQDIWELTTDSKTPKSTLWQWTHMRQKTNEPITISVETKITEFQKAPDSHNHLSVNLIYADKKGRDNVTLPLEMTPHAWKKQEIVFSPKHPVDYFSYTFSLTSPLATMQLKNAIITTPNLAREMFVQITQPLKGSPIMKGQYPNTCKSNGDGSLMLPGATGPLATLRLKLIRDGLEDYEYLNLLKLAVERTETGTPEPRPGWLLEAKNALSIPSSICNSLSSYTLEGKKLLDYRAHLARLLNEIGK